MKAVGFSRTLWLGTGVLVACLAAVPLDAAAPRAKQQWVLYTPDAFARTETIVTKGKERKFYVATPSRPLEFSVAGPADVRIVTRLLFTANMKGTQRYTLNILEDGLLGRERQVASYTFTAKKSRVSTLAGGSKVVPARGRTVTLHLPSGRHRLRLALTDAQNAEVAVRLLLPKKNLGQ